MRRLVAGNSDAIICKIPSVKFVFDSAKVRWPSSDPFIEPATSFGSLIFRTLRHGYNFFVQFLLMELDPLLASVHHFYSAFSLAATKLCFNGRSRSSSTLVSVTNWIHRSPGRRQFGLIKTRPTRKAQAQQKQELRQSSSIIFFLTPNSLERLKIF